jgi:hypothetical protein
LRTGEQKQLLWSSFFNLSRWFIYVLYLHKSFTILVSACFY